MKEQLTAEGFNLLFEDMQKTYPTYIQAYIKAEAKHIEKYGGRRYASYDTFRKCRARMIRK
jgi:hypothetical protein